MGNITLDIKHPDTNTLLFREWLLTNGLGGFATSSIVGTPMRKYHGLLNAALPAPLGRTTMISYVEESIIFSLQEQVPLSFLRFSKSDPIPAIPLIEFKLQNRIPVWIYKIGELILEKRMHLVNRQNTIHINYKISGLTAPVQIKWRPFLHFRNYEDPVNLQIISGSYSMDSHDTHYEVTCSPFPPLRLFNSHNPSFTYDFITLDKVYYEMEEQRGYESVGGLISPGYFITTLNHDNDEFTVVASTESWETIDAISPYDAWQAEKIREKNLLKMAGLLDNPDQSPFALTKKKLILAADQFLFYPITRYKDLVRLQASGEEPVSIIAGYPWFTDWGRDTMISLEGLTLSTGRQELAYSILRTFAYYVKNGLIPNMFPDTEKEARYNTADATLWFFHATDRYIEATQDFHILELLLPIFQDIIDWHIKGTDFGIKVDSDGLLMQGAKGLQLTWMDAKVGDWVVTPRRGKSVEINALWYNALRLMEQWTGTSIGLADTCYHSFNKKFWYPDGEYLYDVIEGENGNDNALRPNQLFAISLRYPALERKYWKAVVDIVQKDLLTPVGLRTLAPSHPDYKSTYDGDLLSRDAAYHQGTVWPWLLGPFVDVWCKVYPDKIELAQNFLKGLETHLNHNCIGSISEIFDAKEPYYGRGCFAQAWSVAEMLRVLIKVTPATLNTYQEIAKHQQEISP